MLRYHIAVCDDEQFAAQVVAKAAEGCLSRLGAQAETEIFNSALELGRRAGQTEFDLVLLDIEMPGMDGIKLARALRLFGTETEIVFVSNNESRVFESLPVRPLAFVRKSRFAEDIEDAMRAFVKQSRASASERMVSFRMRGAMGAFPASRIAYIEARGRTKIVHLSDGRTEEVTNTLDEMEEKLASYGFCRIHKGYLVNLALIESLTADEVEIGKERLPISRARSKQARLAYMDYLGEHNAVMITGNAADQDADMPIAHLRKR